MLAQILEIKGPTGSPLLFEVVLTLLGAIVAWVAGKANLARGKNSPQEQMGEIAGAVIDKQMAESLIACIEKNTSAQRALARALDQNSKVVSDTGNAVAEARTDIRDLERGVRLLAAKIGTS